jgi:VWFA-related protein
MEAVSFMIRIFGFGFVLLGLTAFGQTPNRSDESIMRLDVTLTQVHATVFDASGRVITGLDKGAFKLFVDDVEVPISLFRNEDAPVTAGIVLDNSASMFSRRTEVLAAALAFARASNPQDQMFVVHFNDHITFGLPPGRPFTGKISELETALSQFTAKGTTALYDAIEQALSHLATATLTKRALLIISDGGDNSSVARLPDILRRTAASGDLIYAIGIYSDDDRDRNPHVLTDLAQLSGGSAFFPSAINSITETCTDIAKEIRRQYTLGFNGGEDGKFHLVRVSAEDARFGPLKVRAATGYFAPKRISENQGAVRRPGWSQPLRQSFLGAH